MSLGIVRVCIACGGRWGKDLVRDANHGVRALLRSPGLSAVVALTLTLAIGATTTIFSLVHSVVLKRLPVPAPEHLALLAKPSSVREPIYREFRARQRAFAGVLGRDDLSVDFNGGAFRTRVTGELVTGNYFRVLGVRAYLGRLLDDGDEAGQIEPRAIVISHRLWTQSFRSDLRILERTVRLNGRPFQIIGVTEPGFSGSLLGKLNDFQISVSSASTLGIPIWLQVMGRRRDEVSHAQAQAMTLALGKQLADEFPRLNRDEAFLLEDGSRGFAGLRDRLQAPALLLLAAVGLLLLIACANIAGLLSARAIGRRFEMAVRLALGATRGRLIRQLLVESAVLALAGACGGCLLAYWGTSVLQNVLHNNTAGAALDFSLNSAVLLATTIVSILAALLCGLFPAWQASVTDPSSGLRGGGFFFAARRSLPARRLLVVGQVTLSLVLLSGAGVLARSLRNLQTLDLGFQLDGVVLAKFDTGSYGYSPETAQRLFKRLEEDARRIPQIRSAALSSIGVLSGDMLVSSVRVAGLRPYDVQYHYVSADYFKTLGTSLLRGRDFDNREEDGSHLAAIVNERLAKLCWPDGNAIGRQIRAEGNREIIGVVKNSNYRAVREEPPPTIYLPVSQVRADAFPVMTLFVKMRGSTSAAPQLLATLIRQRDPGLPTMDIQTLDNQRDQTIATERTLAFAALAFAAFAAIIALLGLAGVIAFGVSSRAREIGVRIVCGAGRISIASIFLKETILLIAAGLLPGLPLTWAALKMLSAYVFRTPAQDPYVIGAAIALFISVGVVAVIYPVSRAARIDPADVLRAE